MTITALPSRNEFTATAGQTLFSYTFKIFESTDLNVYVTPAGQDPDDVTDIVTGYSVTGIGDEDGGTITLVVAASVGDLVTIVSDIPENRTTDYQDNGDFLPVTVNADFDRVVALTKQIDEKVNRSLISKESQQGSKPLTLPEPEGTKFLRWKSDLTGVENVDLASNGAPTTADLVTYNQGGTGALDRTVENRLQERRSVLDSGADRDGGVDSYAAFVKAIDSLPDSGGIVYVPSGNYRLDTELKINKHNVFLAGDGQGGDQDGIPTIRATAATRIFRGGSATTPLITFESVGDPKVGGGIARMMLDGSNLTTRVLNILSHRNGAFSDLYVYAGTSSDIFMGATSGTLNFAPYDSQGNSFTNVRTSNRNLGGTAKAMTLSGGQGAGGTVGGNASFNVFINSFFESNNTQNDVSLEDTDNNYFYGCRIDQLSLLSGEQDSSGNDAPARYNQFHGCEILAATCFAGVAGGTSSFSNLFIGLADSNGAVLPVLGVGAGGSDDATATWISSNGKIQASTGINFGNNVAAVNTLDAYEEGSFGPVLTFGGASVGVVYTRQSGKYTVIGDQAIIQIWVAVSSKGSSTGIAKIEGLPFTAAGGGSVETACAARYSSMTGLGGAPQAKVDSSSTTISLEESSATGAVTISDSEFTDTSGVQIQVVYRV
jgi:hypothetical protein